MPLPRFRTNCAASTRFPTSRRTSRRTGTTARLKSWPTTARISGCARGGDGTRRHSRKADLGPQTSAESRELETSLRGTEVFAANLFGKTPRIEISHGGILRNTTCEKAGDQRRFSGAVCRSAVGGACGAEAGARGLRRGSQRQSATRLRPGLHPVENRVGEGIQADHSATCPRRNALGELAQEKFRRGHRSGRKYRPRNRSGGGSGRRESLRGHRNLVGSEVRAPGEGSSQGCVGSLQFWVAQAFRPAMGVTS